jgi:predicted metal-dependent hydrolase
MSSILLWAELHTLSQRIRRRFDLPPFILEPVTHPAARRYGDCEVEGPHPYVVRLRVHQLDGRRPLSRKTILGTLAHELAHLREPRHGKAHRRLRDEIRDFIAEPTEEII